MVTLNTDIWAIILEQPDFEYGQLRVLVALLSVSKQFYQTFTHDVFWQQFNVYNEINIHQHMTSSLAGNYPDILPVKRHPTLRLHNVSHLTSNKYIWLLYAIDRGIHPGGDITQDYGALAHDKDFFHVALHHDPSLFQISGPEVLADPHLASIALQTRLYQYIGFEKSPLAHDREFCLSMVDIPPRNGSESCIELFGRELQSDPEILTIAGKWVPSVILLAEKVTRSLIEACIPTEEAYLDIIARRYDIPNAVEILPFYSSPRILAALIDTLDFDPSLTAEIFDHISSNPGRFSDATNAAARVFEDPQTYLELDEPLRSDVGIARLALYALRSLQADNGVAHQVLPDNFLLSLIRAMNPRILTELQLIRQIALTIEHPHQLRQILEEAPAISSGISALLQDHWDVLSLIDSQWWWFQQLDGPVSRDAVTVVIYKAQQAALEPGTLKLPDDRLRDHNCLQWGAAVFSNILDAPPNLLKLDVIEQHLLSRVPLSATAKLPPKFSNSPTLIVSLMARSETYPIPLFIRVSHLFTSDAIVHPTVMRALLDAIKEHHTPLRDIQGNEVVFSYLNRQPVLDFTRKYLRECDAPPDVISCISASALVDYLVDYLEDCHEKY